ncbi:uncharacterized protein DNG_01497 [Cephalotrichum gorgonifer]|uniref:Molybdenum cofactor sulfurase n=1 Tax=Cephalotrichum gorgonifer TaxID=2041049 RepID=A0AAE8MSQ3_9PEZI|nr:uncharacterized protein DNG_01497 [Cephalotrichum gorgonifer]
MEDVTGGNAEPPEQKPSGTSTLQTWLSAMLCHKGRKQKRKSSSDRVSSYDLQGKLKSSLSSDGESFYDVDAIRKSQYPLLQGVFQPVKPSDAYCIMHLTLKIGEVYLDHAGTTLFPRSAIDSFARDMTSHLYGNPHSESKSSRQSTTRVADVRQRALRFFNASPDNYDLVFVQNATAAIKLVVDILLSHTEDGGGFWYGYHGDSHTSLVGPRQVAKAGFACFDSDQDVEDWIGTGDVRRGEGRPGSPAPTARLFAYPGQSNMTGRRLPLSWPGRLRKSRLGGHSDIYTLLDAAALATTGELDLSNPDESPDFVALSFYKIFGFPDLGALLVRRDLAPMLRRRKYFGGGTVEMVINGAPWHSLKIDNPHEYLEDGTLPFHNIIALGHAMTAHAQLYTSQKLVSEHTARLAKYLYDRLSELRHSDASPICIIYKDPKARYGDASSTGPTIAFNIRYADGSWVKLSDLETLANNHRIHLRTGGVCNPGGIAKALDLAPWEMLRNFAAGTQCGRGPIMAGGKPSGIARVSLGAMSNAHDVDVFIDFVNSQFRDVRPQVDTLELEAGMRLSVSAVMVYPLEGARGWRVPRDVPWPVEASGLRWDRTWFLVNLDNLEVLTCEVAPRLALIYPEIDIAANLLHIRLHRSLETSASSGDSYLSFPLELDTTGGDVDLAVYSGQLGNSAQISTETVKHENLSVSATVYTSKDLVEFFSSALGSNCTLARFSDPVSRDAFGMQPLPDVSYATIVIDDDSRQEIPVPGDTTPPSMLKSAKYDGGDSGISVTETQQSPREALAESIQANIVLTRSPDDDGFSQDQESLFVSVGRSFSVTEANGAEGSYQIVSVAGDGTRLNTLRSRAPGAGSTFYMLPREGKDVQGVPSAWNVETTQQFVIQESWDKRSSNLRHSVSQLLHIGDGRRLVQA